MLIAPKATAAIIAAAGTPANFKKSFIVFQFSLAVATSPPVVWNFCAACATQTFLKHDNHMKGFVRFDFPIERLRSPMP
jgi:hypothetical protein